EQLASGAVDRRSDVWAAGVVLWEMLTGQRLFVGEGHGELVAKVLYGEIQPPARVAPDLEPGLNAVVMRALSREPSERFPSARASGRRGGARFAAGGCADGAAAGARVSARDRRGGRRARRGGRRAPRHAVDGRAGGAWRAVGARVRVGAGVRARAGERRAVGGC